MSTRTRPGGEGCREHEEVQVRRRPELILRLVRRATGARGRRAELASAAVLLAGVCLAACGSSSAPPSSSQSTTTTTSSTTTTTTGSPGGTLQPAALGEGQCQASSLADGSSYGQVAVTGGTSCTTAAAVAAGARPAAGTSYTASGFSCTPTVQGPTTEWTSSWGGTYYSYSCVDGTSQVAFNWGQIYTYGQTVGAATTTALQPAALGAGQCQAAKLPDGSTYAQIAVSNAACAAVAYVAKGAVIAAGTDFTSNGYGCTATPEGAGSPWAAAWSGTYTAYRCTFGTQQLAFTWGKHYVYK